MSHAVIHCSYSKGQDYVRSARISGIFTKSTTGDEIVIIFHHYSRPNLLKMLSEACVYTHGRWLVTWLMCIYACVYMLVPCSPSRLLHALHAALLRSGRSVSPFRQPGPADLKCFQMCVGCDPLAPPPDRSPQAWGPGPLHQGWQHPPRMGVRVAARADDIQTPHPLSTTSGAYYRGDSQSENGGEESEQACVWNICMIRWRCLE